jgi:DNA adenine methylase
LSLKKTPPPFNRIGNKLPMISDILKLIPPHKTYVEVFAGSASVFFNKEKAKHNIINDLDKDISYRLNLLKKAPDDINKYRKFTDVKEVKDFYKNFNSNNASISDKIIYEFIKSSTGFWSKPIQKESQIYKKSNFRTKNLSFYKDKIKDTILTNCDYKKIIDKYDDNETFFFIDPPYETDNSKYYGNKEIERISFEELLNTLKHIKGKFMLTTNDSENIRNLFKDFNIKPIKVFTHITKYSNKPDKDIRKELIIMNY